MKKILVVDDKQSVTTLYRKLIEQDGRYEVFTENVGSRAVETARQCRPDLILLDILMPDTLGSEVAAEIRADPALADTKVVFVTAMLKASEEKKASQAGGGYRILAKPISRQDLFLAINQALASPVGSLEENDTTFDIH
jgi:two-component system sensor histidine kinase/response regulator